ncbi:DoxX family protein [Arenibacter amylolyticus]|uniref:DoxX family protein n=1 Tax=Arenibacter amylolyticus TaxID=1406873 RepID=UPI000A35EC3D|nr:DoxX family protein [Arenibacter amylolyticus]
MKQTININRRSVQILRIAVSGIFLLAGLNHLIQTEQVVGRIATASLKDFAYFFGDPTFLVILSGIVMLVAGIAFLIGYKTKWAAWILIAVLIPITITIQIGQATTLGPLFKNVAIFGGLLFFVLNDTENVSKKLSS